MGKRLNKDHFIMAGILAGNLTLVWRFFSLPFASAFSAPVVPILSRVLTLFGVGNDWAVRWVLLAFFVIGPVALFFLVKEVTGRRMSAVMAAVVYSLPIFRSRFEALTVLGDGAHIAALTLLPLAAFFLLRFLKHGSFPAAIWASLSVLLVALTSPFGLFVLFTVFLVMTFSEMLLGSGRLKFFRFLVVVILSLGLSAFWYNPEFVRLTLFSASGKAVIEAVKNLVPLSFFMVPILGTFGFLLFDKRVHLQPLFVALGLTIVFGLITFAGNLAPFAVSAQNRYMPEVAMAIAMLWGVVGTFTYDYIATVPVMRWFPVPMGKRRFVQKGLVLLFVLFVFLVGIFYPYQGSSTRRGGRVMYGITDVAMSGLGEIRERTDVGDRIIGYVISGLTVVFILGIYHWLRKEEASVKKETGS